MAGAILAGGCASPEVSFEPLPGGPPRAPGGRLERVELLRIAGELLEHDTSQPLGRERPAALALREVLRREGIETEVIEAGPGRASVYARLKGLESGRAPLLLLSHLDAHPFDRGAWPKETPPLAATLLDGTIHGRGILDGKGLAAIHAAALIVLHRQGVALPREVVLVAAADGLSGHDTGLARVLEVHPELANAALALAKGGASIRDLLGDGRTIHTLATSERGLAMLELVALASDDLEAGARLSRGLARVLGHRSIPRLSDPVAETLAEASRGAAFPRNLTWASSFYGRTVLTPMLAERGATRPWVEDTVRLSHLSAGQAGTRAAPARARAVLSCFLLPGTSPSAMRQRIRALLEDPKIHVTIGAGSEASSSRVDPAVLDLLGAYAERPDLEPQVVAPALASEPTGARLLRSLGVPVVGFVPLAVSPAELARVHGPGEQVSFAELEHAVARLAELVRHLAIRLSAAEG